MSNVYPFSLQQAIIAPANADGTYGTAVTLASTKTLTMAQKYISDTARGNAKITALAAQTESYDVALDTAGFDDSVLAVLIGVTAVASNTGSRLRVPNQLAPYFGLIGQTYPDSGDVLLFFPYCKVTSDFTFKLEYGKIVVPQFKMMAIQHPVLGYMLEKLTRPDSTAAIAFPPQIPA